MPEERITRERKTNRNRLTTEETAEASVLYENEGWRILWIARKFNVDHTSIIYLIKKRKLVRRVSVPDHKPEEIISMYRRRLDEARETKEDSDDDSYPELLLDDENTHVKSYANIIKEATQRRSHTADNECSHPRWIKRCSLCKTILESDSQCNHIPSAEAVRLVYNDFDKMVCSYSTSLDLQSLGVSQQSMLYWIFHENQDVLTLRIRNNLPERTDENALIASAFTSQELFKYLLRVNPSLKTESFNKKLILNGDNPNYLGKLLCRCLRKVERARARRISLSKENQLISEKNESTVS